MKKTILALLLALIMVSTALAEGGDHSGIADASEMTDVIDVVPEGMVPVAADRLNEGTWEVAVDSSSSMFKIVGCALTVQDGALTARLSMKSDSYQYLFPGTPEQAAVANEQALIPLEVGEDGFFFSLPVAALDAGVECAAFSTRKQVWYPRTLLFRADSLPAAAWRADEAVTAATLGLADGDYAAAVTLEGGSTGVESPAILTVAGDACTARVVFSTRKIDYVILDGEKYLPVEGADNATFDIPVTCFDRALSIIVDSTAMKPAVEVPYAITFASDGIAPAE